MNRYLAQIVQVGKGSNESIFSHREEGYVGSVIDIKGAIMKHPFSVLIISIASICVVSPAFAVDNEQDDGQRRGHIGKGTNEFILSGAGTSDKKFDNNIFNLNLSYGQYLTEENMLGVRQAVSANNNQEADETDFNGSTRLFYDYQFDMDNWKPFVGVSIGYIYGETLEESWIAGPELGIKYYVFQNTFIAAQLEYQFLFDDADDADDQFEDGVYIYSLGTGFNF